MGSLCGRGNGKKDPADSGFLTDPQTGVGGELSSHPFILTSDTNLKFV